MKELAQFFNVLADETRLKLLWLLCNHRELCVCDLMAALAITQSKASRHLATLRHAGLVVDRREAAWSHYSLRPVASEPERAQLDALRAALAGYPGAARVLADLHAWMARKDRELACAADAACAPASARRLKAQRR